MKRTKGTECPPQTPKEAVRNFCLRCVGSSAEVEECEGDDLLNGDVCLFFRYRTGNGRPRLKLIRQFCLVCMGDQRKLVAECASKKCPLHAYRMNINPNRQGVGGGF